MFANLPFFYYLLLCYFLMKIFHHFKFFNIDFSILKDFLKAFLRSDLEMLVLIFWRFYFLIFPMVFQTFAPFSKINFSQGIKVIKILSFIPRGGSRTAATTDSVLPNQKMCHNFLHSWANTFFAPRKKVILFKILLSLLTTAVEVPDLFAFFHGFFFFRYRFCSF